MRLTRRRKRRILLLLTVALLAAVGITGFKTVRTIQQAKLVAEARVEGLAAHEAGDLDRALMNLSYFFARKKTDLPVNLAFADSRSRLPLPGGRHLMEAADLYTTHGLRLVDDLAKDDSSLDVKGTRRQILNRLLYLYGQLGLRFELKQTAGRLLELDPHCIDALAAKAQLMFVERRFDEALAIGTQLIELEPENLVWRRLYLEVQGRQGVPPEQLLAKCHEWAGQYHKDGRYHMLAASILLELGSHEQALQEMNMVMTLGAGTRDVLERAVQLFDALDEHEHSARLIAQTLEQYPEDLWVRHVAVRRYWHIDELEMAQAVLSKAQRDLSLLDRELWRLQVMVHTSAGRTSQARAALESVIKGADSRSQDDQDLVWAKAVVAFLKAKDGGWRRVADELEFAAALMPRDAMLHYLLGTAYTKLGEHGDALEAYSQAYALEPEWLAAASANGQAQLAAGRLEPAYETAKAAFTRAPKNRLAPFLLFVRADLALREAGLASTSAQLAQRDPTLLKDVIAMLRTVRDEVPEHPEVCALLCRAFIQNDQRDNAAALMREVMDSSQSRQDVLLALAAVSRRFGLNAEQELLDRAVGVAGLTVPIAFTLADIHAQRGDYAAGLQIINQALQSSSLNEVESRNAHAARAALMLQMGHPDASQAMQQIVVRYADAVEIQQFVLSQPNSWDHAELASAAIANLRRALGEESALVRLADANFILKHASQDQAQRARASGHINSVLKRLPDSLAALSLLAEAVMLGDRPNLERAIETLERGITIYPAEPSLLVRLISLLQIRGDYERAGRYLRALAKLSAGDPQVRGVELELLQAQGDFETALVRARSLVDDRSSPRDQLVLAAMYVRTGRNQDAEALYDRLLSDPNASALAAVQAAEFYASIGQLSRAIDVIHAANLPGESGGARKAMLTASFHQRFGDPRDATHWLQRAVADDPGNVEAHLELARHLLAQNDREAARTQALEGLKIKPKHAELRATLAIASLGSPGGREKAIAVLREISGGDNDSLLATLELLQQVARREGKPHPTDANLAAAVRLIEEHGQFMPAWLLAISMHVEAGRKSDAIAIARRAVGRFAIQIEPAQWATQLLMQEKRWSEALVEAQEWRRRTLNDARAADVALAAIHLEMRRPAEAVARLTPYADDIAAKAADQPEPMALWIRALASGGEYAQAEKAVRPLLKDVRWRQAWLAIGIDLPEAQAVRALKLLSPTAVEPRECIELAAYWTELGKRSSDEGCFSEAEALVQRAAAADAQYAVAALVARGSIAQARGHLRQAESLYRQALHEQPDNAPALNNLAYVLAMIPGRCGEALSYIERALRLAPDQADVLDTYAHVLLCQDREDEAEAALRRALLARPDDLRITLRLADAQLRSGRFEEAEQTLGEAQRLLSGQPRPDPQDQQDVQELRQRIRKSASAASSEI